MQADLDVHWSPFEPYHIKKRVTINCIRDLSWEILTTDRIFSTNQIISQWIRVNNSSSLTMDKFLIIWVTSIDPDEPEHLCNLI